MSSTWDPDETLPLGERPTPPVLAPVAGRYRIGELLGRGGCGQVHRARDLRTGRDVAIKFIVRMGPGAERQIRRELTALRLLDLPGVVSLLDDGVDKGQVFLVMPLLDGGTFDGLGEGGAWSTWRDGALAVLEALARVHFAGVVHRDLKPNNILLDADGRPHITDFGLAVGGSIDTAAAPVIEGTPRYMSPEQRRGEAGDERSDLFALGVMFREILGDAPAPAHVRQVFASMARERPEDRPASALEVIRALGGAADAVLRGRVDELPEPVTAEALRALFDEPTFSFLRVAEDASSVLLERTGGDREAVAREISAWVRAGRCHWRDGRLHMGRPAVDALLREDRGDVAGLVRAVRESDEGRALALRLAREARATGGTPWALSLVLPFAGPDEDDVAEAIVDLTLARQQRGHVDHALYLAQRFGWEDGLGLLRGAHESFFEDPERGVEELSELGLGARPVLEGWRLALLLFVGSRVRPRAVPGWLDAARQWAGDDPGRLGRMASWEARTAYNAGDYERAYALEQRGMALATTPFERMARATNAAAAAMNVPDLDGAADLARQAMEMALELRHAPGEVRAVWLLCSVRYRRGDAVEPRPELVDAARVVSPIMAAQIAQVEGARAWRQGRLELARKLAAQAIDGHREAGSPNGLALALGLGLLSGAAGDAPDVAACKPAVALECAAMCARAGRPVRVEHDPAQVAGRMLNVLHGDEVVDCLSTGS